MKLKLTIAEQQLNKMLKGEEVRRWDIFANRHQVREFYTKEKYIHLINEVEDLIDSARDSL